MSLSSSSTGTIQFQPIGKHTFVSTGQILDITLAYKRLGKPDCPTVLVPTCYGGRIDETLYHVDETEYDVLVVAMIGNGESSSPSNTKTPFDGPRFPQITYADQVKCQKCLLDILGVKHLRAVIGFSMGAQQAYTWAVMYPTFMDKIVTIAGTARTSMHNIAMLEGPANGLISSADFNGGNYHQQPKLGIKAFGRAWSAWAMSFEWYKRFKTHDELEEYLTKNSDDWGWDANNLLVLLRCWQNGWRLAGRDDFETSMQNIQAAVLAMPIRTDQYFTPLQVQEEVKLLKNGTLFVVDSVWGHVGGGGANATDTEQINQKVRAFLKA